MTENSPGGYPNQQQPPSYSSVHPEGAYASYAQAYGHGLPQQMDKPTPAKSIKIAAILTYIIVGINLVSQVLSFVFREEIAQSTLDSMGGFMTGAESAEMDALLQEQLALQTGEPMMIMQAIIQVIIAAAIVAFVIFMVKGHNWARIVLTIFAAITVLGLFSFFGFFLVFHWTMLLGPLAALVAIAALVFYWLPASNTYMREMRAYKAWEKQRAYMGS